MNGLTFLDSLARIPRRVLVAIDAVAVTLVVVALAGASYFNLEEPEIVLHGLWICLVIEAFLFGLRVTLKRIAVATAFLVAYAVLVDPKSVGAALEIEELALSDWPLMVAVSVIVALMAERVIRSGRRYAALYRMASDQLLTAQEDERRRLAQDLHDSVGQALTGLVLTLDATEKILWRGDEQRSEPGRDALHHAQDLAVAALGDTRDLASRLRPARLEEAGLGAAIRELAAKAGRAIEVRVEPDVCQPGMLQIDREIEVYRITQEALGNATRHAAAGRIWIALERRRKGLFLRVGDDGIGFDPSSAPHDGLGLVGMRERANVLDADLIIRSSPGNGASIELTVPWDSSMVRSSPTVIPLPKAVT